MKSVSVAFLCILKHRKMFLFLFRCQQEEIQVLLPPRADGTSLLLIYCLSRVFSVHWTLVAPDFLHLCD